MFFYNKNKGKIDREKYNFTEDWFSHESESHVVDQFEKFLKKYRKISCKFLEIGSFEGMSAIWMLENILTHKDSKLWCIDPGVEWTGYLSEKEANNAFERLLSNINKSGFNENVKIIKGKSGDYLARFPKNYFDFIYVDGNHEAEKVLEDAIMSFRILNVGGIMALDDYLLGIRWPNSPGAIACNNLPKKAIDYFLEIYKGKIEILYKDYQVWIKKIKE